ncbi:hypothetical protein AFLA_013839 [Aspergillus flavus NRRL3357]|nr:hypothetical protein AFLA_013839 [Aspergillus flavus NRRL3357]
MVTVLLSRIIGHRHINRLPPACYSWGTVIVLNSSAEMIPLKWVAVFVVVAIFATTRHAHSFRNRSGDALMCRKTIPMLVPQGIAQWPMSRIVGIVYGLL